jgi:fatty acid synthase
VCSSLPQSEWNTPAATYSSAEYHTNNLLNAVLFEEASQHIPHNAITVEIAPHGLLQAILKRSLNKGITNIALTQRGHPDCSECVFTALGKCVSFLFIHLFVYGLLNDAAHSSRPHIIKW